MDDYSMLKDLVEKSLETNKSIGLILIVLISINIVIESIRFIYKLILANNNKKIKRQLLIEEKRLKIIEQLFQSLDNLTLLDARDNELLLHQLKEINLYISQNRIYIPRSYQNCTNEILDYFKNVLTDFRQKSIEKETQLFNKFCNEFNR
jgi:hypothetical protein